MYVLNQGMKKNAVPDKDDDDDQQQQQSTDKPAPKAPASAGNVADPLPSEITVGNPAQAKYHVTLGWSYDENAVAHQEEANRTVAALQGWARAHGNAVSLEIVNLDVPAQELSPYAASVQSQGLAVNGNPTFSVNGKQVQLSGNIGQGNMSLPSIMPVLNSVVK